MTNDWNNIDKANHMIEFNFPLNKNTIVTKNVQGYIYLIYRYQLVSTTFNNWAWLYKTKNKLIQALRWLYQALKADKDLVRLYSKISEIRVNRKIEGDSKVKELDDLTMNDSNRNDFASTYLNIWAILSLMGNHDKALHMSQKAIEMVTNRSITQSFTLQDFIDQLEDETLKITLAASYYNEAVELDHMHNANFTNKEYLAMACEAIENANLVAQYIPDRTKITLKEEILKLYTKIQYKKAGTFGIAIGSRGESRKSNNRIYSPPSYGNKIRDTNISDLKQYFDTTPKSFDAGSKYSNKDIWSPDSTYPYSKSSNVHSKKDRVPYPIYKRSNKSGSDNGNITEMIINNHSPFDSDSNLEADDSSAKFSDASIPRPQAEHPYFSRRNGKQNIKRGILHHTRETGMIAKFRPQNDLPMLSKNNDPKTSFDWKPVIKNRTVKIDRNSMPERHYALDESDFIQDWNIKAKKKDKIRCLKL